MSGNFENRRKNKKSQNHTTTHTTIRRSFAGSQLCVAGIPGENKKRRLVIIITTSVWVWHGHRTTFLSEHCRRNTQGDGTVPPESKNVCARNTKQTKDKRSSLDLDDMNLQHPEVQADKCGVCGVGVFTIRTPLFKTCSFDVFPLLHKITCDPPNEAVPHITRSCFTKCAKNPITCLNEDDVVPHNPQYLERPPSTLKLTPKITPSCLWSQCTH